jgi:hypothetical protein
MYVHGTLVFVHVLGALAMLATAGSGLRVS